MKLKKCQDCKAYTLKDICENCKKESSDAHYKFVKIRDAPKSTMEHFNKRRGINPNTQK